MDDTRAVNKIYVNLPKEKMDFINDAHQKELQCYKNIALASKNENEKKQLTDLVSLRVFLAPKAVVKNDEKNVNEIIFYLKNQYIPHNEERGTFIEDIQQEDRLSFETISDPKTFRKLKKKTKI